MESSELYSGSTNDFGSELCSKLIFELRSIGASKQHNYEAKAGRYV